jgi:hypothetical protein
MTVLSMASQSEVSPSTAIAADAAVIAVGAALSS